MTPVEFLEKEYIRLYNGIVKVSMLSSIEVAKGMEKKLALSQHDVSDSYYSSNPKDHNKTFETWDELFEFQAKKDGANYTMLKEWLKKFCEVPNIKDE